MRKQPQITEATQKKLIDSFWKLYQKEDVIKITVGTICKKAGFDRTTFYRYFNGISDLLDFIEDNLINSIKSDIKNNYRHDTNDKIVFDGFKKFNDKYGERIVVFYEKGNRRFYHKFKELIKTDAYAYFKIDIKDESKKEFVFEFMFASLLNSYAYWYRNQDMANLESFVKLTNKMLIYGTKEIIN